MLPTYDRHPLDPREIRDLWIAALLFAELAALAAVELLRWRADALDPHEGDPPPLASVEIDGRGGLEIVAGGMNDYAVLLSAPRADAPREAILARIVTVAQHPIDPVEIRAGNLRSERADGLCRVVEFGVCSREGVDVRVEIEILDPTAWELPPLLAVSSHAHGREFHSAQRMEKVVYRYLSPLLWIGTVLLGLASLGCVQLAIRRARRRRASAGHAS